MNIGRLASALHIICASFVLWIVPAQYVFFIDLVAFPVSLFLTLRDIIKKYQCPSSLRENAPTRDSVAESAQTTARVDGSRAGVRQRTKEGNIQETVPLDKPEPVGKSAKRLPAGKTMLLFVKVALFAMVIDFVYRPLLAPAEDLFVFRPGYVSHDSAKLHIRYTDGGNLEMRYRKINANGFEFADNMPWESAGEFGPPTNQTDYTTTTTLQNLQPATRYLVELHSRLPTLHAQTALLGSVEFKTAPPPHMPTRLRFGTGSCIKPNFPYRPSKTPDIYGFSSMLDHSDSLDMIMFMGDFVYADVPLYFGPTTEDYRRLYRQVYAAQSSRRLLRKVPMLHVYDDHEIKNNWHKQDQPPMGNAMTAYNEYNGLPNPPSDVPNTAYYNFTYGNIAFYAWDTRRYRTHWETPNNHEASTMLGLKQKQHFIQWLHDVNHTAAVKFVVSSVPVTTGWSNFDSSQDTWRGYPTERAEILNLTQHIPNLFFLSGDRHEMAAVELPSGNIEFSTSPISQFTFPLVGKFKKDLGGERTLHYRRQGHVKYGILDVDTEPAIPRITYSLYTTDVHQGKRPAWVYEARGAIWR
ncbi:hypothetical protein LPJ78_004912 [Coemansia sp. RSA 989]|nr:hypothetical protein LPJ68_004587 [Coemansia sp. RSA 1086]KAJ1749242.1 hypothetical protein LPJ79_003896 [Coemansia sp. RSA 1821]KAJ1862147.1 hypothetical protein LPJ78_004912 [Coemansia sp. RSA 989]KAJ1871176.1 hypothetical protein LPJ55_004109 [Coemansia sp. RSA 990]